MALTPVELALYLGGFVALVAVIAREALNRRAARPPVGKPRLERDEDGIEYVRFF